MNLLAISLLALINAQQFMEPVDPFIGWKTELRQCESGGNDKALNPKDTDGTESIGRYQFKTKTFYGFAKQYKIKVTDVWNGDEQEQILDRMIRDKSLNLKTQFPGCIKKIGLPIIGENSS